MLGVLGIEQTMASRQPYALSVGPIDAIDTVVDRGSVLQDLGERMPICIQRVTVDVVKGDVQDSADTPETLGGQAKYSQGSRVPEFETTVAVHHRNPLIE